MVVVVSAIVLTSAVIPANFLEVAVLGKDVPSETPSLHVMLWSKKNKELIHHGTE